MLMNSYPRSVKLNGHSAGRASRLTRYSSRRVFHPIPTRQVMPPGRARWGRAGATEPRRYEASSTGGSPTAFPLRGALKFCCNAARQSREAPPNGPRTAAWGAGGEARPAATGRLRAAKPPAPAPPAGRPDPTRPRKLAPLPP